MPTLIVWLSAATLTIGLLVALVKYVILPIVHIAEALETVESHTKQLTTNGGEHLADAVRRTEKKVDGLTAEQAVVRAELATQQESIAEDLKTHRSEVANEFGAVWRELATRQIHKAADQFLAEADRVEGKPRVEG
jgi:hypothetical protein